ncbi:MAG: hypothetical protein KHZ62_07665 [Clostridiales bacterium]|nr:hypothetical protein [Clostridiales bacterium]
MEGIEKLTGRIANEADEQVNSILAAAQKEAGELILAKETEAKAFYEEAVEKGKKAASQKIERMESVARLEIKKQMLSVRQNMISEAFRLAEEALTKLDEAKKIELLAALAAESSESGKEEMILTKSDKDQLGEKVAEKANEFLSTKGKTAQLTVSSDTREISGGLILKDGSIEINCSFETLLRFRREELAADVSDILFKES